MIPSGLLLVNKPLGVTSHDVVQVVRRKLAQRRVGHTGTLDPMAEGLLILLAGSATAAQHALQGHDKWYEATLRLGLQTDSGDATGAPVRDAPIPALDLDRLAAVLASFRGPLTQTPPAYSAVKVRGHPAYWWARRRQPVTLSSRTVQVFEIALVHAQARDIIFRVHCSAGTYVRTLGEAIAEHLGTVGHISALVRLRVGPWDLHAASPLSWIQQATEAQIVERLLPVMPPTYGTSARCAS